ncbi:MAG: hypothetical protein U9Q06_02275 [Nanoarchaeota archaeon]|nr:hypothetical protein [Nanoarchaeota archaeon]
MDRLFEDTELENLRYFIQGGNYSQDELDRAIKNYFALGSEKYGNVTQEPKSREKQ